ncbi:hypothetical protein LXL04_023373 [Taraxacum kok-saghyz]
MEGVAEVLLPFSIERLLEEMCLQKGLEMPDVAARKTLSKISKESAIDVMKRDPMHYSSEKGKSSVEGEQLNLYLLIDFRNTDPIPSCQRCDSLSP